MLLKIFLITLLSIVRSRAEAPFNNQAPYAAAGYRPDIPFDLPGEYYPSFDVETEQQLPNQGFSFEITKQRVDFAGQEVQRVPISEPQNQYLPPDQIVFINNRVGSNNRRTQHFGHGHNHRRQNGNRPGQRPTELPENNPPSNFPPFDNTPSDNPPQNRPPQFQPNLPPVNIPLPRPNTDERFESQQKPALQYGPPSYIIDPRNSGQKQSQSSLEYGAPNNNLENQQPALEYGPPANSQNNYDDELEKQYALDALNAAVQNYNRLQENNNDKIAQGQYFVVNPDHSIQKVKFTTKKSDDETKQNDFTAELKYTKVGEINDPLYKYTAEGQLVRIVKK